MIMVGQTLESQLNEQVLNIQNYPSIMNNVHLSITNRQSLVVHLSVLETRG